MKEPDISSEILDKLAAVFANWPELEEVVLYGSRAIGTATARSDIDLATIGIEDELRLGQLALDLEDLEIPQKWMCRHTMVSLTHRSKDI